MERIVSDISLNVLFNKSNLIPVIKIGCVNVDVMSEQDIVGCFLLVKNESFLDVSHFSTL